MSLAPARIFSRARAAPRITWKLARFGRPRRLVLFGPVSLGDDLLCTAIFREWRRRGERDLWMMSRNPDLFAGNADIDRVAPIDDYFARALTALGTQVVQPYYRAMKPDDGDGPAPTEHFIAQMCALAGLRGEIALRPYLTLAPEERAAGRIAVRQIVIQSTGRSAVFGSANKEWVPGGFQEVVNALHGEFEFVQLGAASDPALAGVHDLRGRTSLRESARIVASSVAVVCLEGFLMHLARAVDVRSVVIYGGALDPAISGYAANENLFNAVPCAPCWWRNRCDYEHRCMTGITSEHVIAAVRRAVAATAAGEPLVTTTVQLP